MRKEQNTQKHGGSRWQKKGLDMITGQFSISYIYFKKIGYDMLDSMNPLAFKLFQKILPTTIIFLVYFCHYNLQLK